MPGRRKGGGPTWRASQPQFLVWLNRMMPPTYGKAYRWVGEMEEIARFYEGMAADHAGPQQATAALTDFLKRS